MLRVAPPPRFDLVAGPTPLQRASGLEAVLATSPLYVKRDDLTGFAVAGNKARKLELLVADALTSGADVLVTGGGPRSNHVAATAAAARVAGLDCLLLLFGSPPRHDPPNLALARRFGATVLFTGSDDRASVDPALQTAARSALSDGRCPYVVPRGGATGLGSAAYALAALELAGQLAAIGVAGTVTVVVAVGSCGTQAGLVAGNVGLGRPWRVVGASVSRPVPECEARVLDLAAGAARLLGLEPPDAADVTVRDARGPGYGAPSAAGSSASWLAARHQGLLLDPTYTAKAFGHLLAEVRGGLAGPVVFWHTGGTAEALAEGTRGGP